MSRHSAPWLLVLAVLFGCSESVSPEAQPGTISVTSPTLAGQAGLTFLVFADDAAWTTTPDGSYCEQISGDPATITGTISQSLTQPCDLGDPLEFPPGTYFVFGGIFVPGATSPMQCTEGQVTVDGDVSITLPDASAGACP